VKRQRDNAELVWLLGYDVKLSRRLQNVCAHVGLQNICRPTEETAPIDAVLRIQQLLQSLIKWCTVLHFTYEQLSVVCRSEMILALDTYYLRLDCFACHCQHISCS